LLPGKPVIDYCRGSCGVFTQTEIPSQRLKQQFNTRQNRDADYASTSLPHLILLIFKLFKPITRPPKKGNGDFIDFKDKK